MPNPDITVVIPAWNLGAELKEAVASLREQDPRPKVLIVDNASDTPLPKISGTRTLRLPQRVTIGEARNAAINQVDTPYLLFLDADDRLLPGALARLHETLSEEPQAVAAAGQILDWNPATDARQPAWYPPNYVYALNRFPGLHAWWNSVRYCTIVVGALIRTDAARRVPGFPNLNYGEDWAFSALLAFRGRIILTRDPSKLYRLDPAPKRETLGSNKKHLAPAYRRGMREVRRRLWRGGPVWVRPLLPLIWLLQYVLLAGKLWRARRPRAL